MCNQSRRPRHITKQTISYNLPVAILHAKSIKTLPLTGLNTAIHFCGSFINKTTTKITTYNANHNNAFTLHCVSVGLQPKQFSLSSTSYSLTDANRRAIQNVSISNSCKNLPNLPNAPHAKCHTRTQPETSYGVANTEPDKCVTKS